MAVLKCTVLICSVCGGEVDVNADMSVGVCKFCESVITIPKELGRKGNLYNRATFLRQNNEFDKALAIYEDILKEDNSDAEAHWGLVLSKFGIEYVLDPKSQERIPTCHRTQPQSILSDPDYLVTLEHSDIEAQRVIEREAKRINEIQTRILEISQKETPYDIFICYKESDELGNRTEDSTLAQDIYYELKKKGYRIFFARKTLESKLGAEYEPIIFAALNSAKVMIVLGTKAEHFNAVWVRNEWGRFLKMSKDSHKVIIPAYRDMSPYELPAELSVFQSQDMSKIGFMQDLTDGIERCMRGDIMNETAKTSFPQSYGTAPLERLLQNSTTYLKLSNYNSAEEVFTTVTKEYPEDHRGWWGLIVCKTRNFSEVILDQTMLNTWFGYVKQLAAPKDFKDLENQYVDYTKKVSQLAADEDMKIVNSTINKYNSEISSLNNQIKSLNARITERENKWKSRNQEENDIIQKEKQNITTAENERSRKTIGLTGGCILLGVGVLTLLTGGWAILWGVILGISGLAVLTSNGCATYQQLDNRVANARLAIQSAKSSQSNYKKKFDMDVASLKIKISEQEANIVNLQEKISNCRKYLDLGKDKISEYWFSKECEAFGVSKTFDNYIQEYRKFAFDIAEKTVDDTVNITCPYCGEEIVESRSILVAIGDVVCKTCGCTIKVSASSLPSDSSKAYEEAPDTFYSVGLVEVTASVPGKVFKIEASAGQAVSVGTPIIILKAMKMEIPVVAPQDGTVASINVSVGDAVESGDVLATMD